MESIFIANGVPVERFQIFKTFKKYLCEAIQLGSEATLDAMSFERSGVTVRSNNLRDESTPKEKSVWPIKNISNQGKQRPKIADLTYNCEACWVIDKI